jgi:hypothetical protein
MRVLRSNECVSLSMDRGPTATEIGVVDARPEATAVHTGLERL